MSKKVLVVINNIWPPPVVITGIGVVYETYKELAKLGYEVHFLTSIGFWEKNLHGSRFGKVAIAETLKWQREQSKRYHLKFHTYNINLFSRFPVLAFILNRLAPLYFVPCLQKKFHYDLVCEYSSTPILVYRSWLLKSLLSVKSFHFLMTQVPTFMGSPKWLSLFKPKIDKVICPNKAIMQNIISIGYPKDHLFYLSLGVNSAKFSNVPRKKPTPLLTCLFLAPLDSIKGPDIFVKACLRIIETDQLSPKKVQFVIATYESGGKIPYSIRKEEILKAVNKYPSYFQFYEGVLDVKKLYSVSDIVVIPQTTIDGATGHPVTLLEAMVAGKIVIASDVPGMDEVVKDNVNGYLFKNKDPKSLAKKITFVIKNRAKLTMIEANAIESVSRQHGVDNIAKKIAKLYESTNEGI